VVWSQSERAMRTPWVPIGRAPIRSSSSSQDAAQSRHRCGRLDHFAGDLFRRVELVCLTAAGLVDSGNRSDLAR
jgi:hypothetical protein